MKMTQPLSPTTKAAKLIISQSRFMPLLLSIPTTQQDTSNSSLARPAAHRLRFCTKNVHRALMLPATVWW